MQPGLSYGYHGCVTRRPGSGNSYRGDGRTRNREINACAQGADPGKRGKSIQMIQQGSKVSIEYTLTLDDDSVVSTNVGEEPLVYEQGAGETLAALEEALAGLEVNDSKEVKLSPQQAFGEVDPARFEVVPPDRIPEDARKSGTLLTATDSQGQQTNLRVHEVHDDRIVLDLNHPLAGKAVTFDVRIVSID